MAEPGRSSPAARRRGSRKRGATRVAVHRRPARRSSPNRLIALALAALAAGCSGDRQTFGRVTLAPDFVLDGAGTNVDSIAFWEAPDPRDTLLFVTAKGNQRVEVWRFPFAGRELEPLTHPSFGSGTHVNGIAVDPARDRLYVAVSRPASTIVVFRLPERQFAGELDPGIGDLGAEPNLALLHGPDGTSRLYVSADDRVGVLDPATGAIAGRFEPSAGLETIAADDREQVLYIPDENGGTGVYAYDPSGAPHAKGATHRLGAGVFDADAEGIVLYRCLDEAGGDDGRGFLVVADQRADETEFEIFDRRSWRHLGAVVLAGVSNTDGIGSTQQAFPRWPLGLFAAIDDDTRTVGIGWHRILEATGLSCTGPPLARGVERRPRAGGGPTPMRVGFARTQLRAQALASPALPGRRSQRTIWGVYTTPRMD